MRWKGCSMTRRTMADRGRTKGGQSAMPSLQRPGQREGFPPLGGTLLSGLSGRPTKHRSRIPVDERSGHLPRSPKGGMIGVPSGKARRLEPTGLDQPAWMAPRGWGGFNALPTYRVCIRAHPSASRFLAIREGRPKLSKTSNFRPGSPADGSSPMGRRPRGALTPAFHSMMPI